MKSSVSKFLIIYAQSKGFINFLFFVQFFFRNISGAKTNQKEKYMLKGKRKKGLRKGTLKEKAGCRVDENIESHNMSLKIALDSINREVKEGTIVSWN